MMVNNSTNINKANNDLSPQIIEHKKTMTYDRNPGPGLGQAQIVAGVNRLMGCHYGVMLIIFLSHIIKS